MPLMPDFRTQLKKGAATGAKRGWSSFVWICKIIIPVSLLVALLQWSGWLNHLDFLLHPLMRLVNLPPEAALPIITGMLTNIYAVIAMITVMSFTTEQMTLIAIFNMIAHGLIMEGIIQHKSGINVIKITLARITVAILTVLIVSPFLGDTSQSVAVPAYLTADIAFLGLLKDWAVDTVSLLLKIFGIIMVIMVMLESFRSVGWIEHSVRFFRPLTKTLGLSDRTVAMWVTGVIFGLLYGGAVIVGEAKKEALDKDELERIHLSLGINHAIVEDPSLFAILGLNPFWLWVPRFVMAILVVQAYRAVRYLKRVVSAGT